MGRTHTQTTQPRAHSAMSIRTLECFTDAEIHTEGDYNVVWVAGRCLGMMALKQNMT